MQTLAPSTYIDPSQFHPHILSKLAFRLRRWFGVLFEFALENLYFFLPKTGLRFVGLRRRIRQRDHRSRLVSHGKIV